MEKNYLSKEKHNEIQEELGRLKSEGRRDIAERLKAAKDLGDLSENSDYQEARDEQMRLEQRINQIEDILRSSAIIHKAGGAVTTIRLGTHVKVKRDGKLSEYTIVGSNESNPVEGLVSNESPIGKALLGKRAGETIVLKTPKGEVKITISSIE
jgi:transcription elongation factor GreA